MFQRFIFFVFLCISQLHFAGAIFEQNRFESYLGDAQTAFQSGNTQEAISKAQTYMDLVFPHRCGGEKVLAEFYAVSGQKENASLYAQLDRVCSLFIGGDFQKAYDNIPKTQEQNLNVSMYKYYIGRLLGYDKNRPSHSVLKFHDSIQEDLLNNTSFQTQFPTQYVLFNLINFADVNDIKSYSKYYQYVIGKDYLAKPFFIPQEYTLTKKKAGKDLDEVLQGPDIILKDEKIGVKTSAHSRVYWYYMDEAITEKNPVKFFENFINYYHISGQEPQLYGRALFALERMGTIEGAQKIIAKEFGSLYSLFAESYVDIVPLQDNSKDYKGVFSLDQMQDLEKKFDIVFEYYLRNKDMIELNYPEPSFFITRIVAPFNIVANFQELNPSFFFSDDTFLLIAQNIGKFPEFMILRGKDDRNYIQRINPEKKEKSGIYFYGNYVSGEDYAWIVSHTQEASMQQIIQVFNNQYQHKDELDTQKPVKNTPSDFGKTNFFARYSWYIFAVLFIIAMSLTGFFTFRKS